MNRSPVGARRSGVSLIEVIVSVAILSILLVIVLPSIRFARLKAESVSNLSDLRSHALVISMYHGDWRDTFPVYIDPKVGTGVLPGAGIEIGYFSQSPFWAIPLLEKYYRMQSLGDSFYTKRAASNKELYTIGDNPSYVYSASFLADPAYWSLKTRLEPPMQIRAVRSSEVRFPAQKALFETIEASIHDMSQSTTQPSALLLAFVDASAASVPANRTNASVSTGPGFFAPWASGPYPMSRVLYTVNGVHGTDVLSR